jgi:hypothetical protein
MARRETGERNGLRSTSAVYDESGKIDHVPRGDWGPSYLEYHPGIRSVARLSALCAGCSRHGPG